MLLVQEPAAKSGFRAVAELLLAGNADVNAKDDNGRTPLYHAAARRNRAIVELLRKHGGVSTVEPIDNKIHSAARNGRYIKVWQRIKWNPDRVLRRDVENQTPLHLAAEKGHKRLVKLLLANKAEINARDGDGRTALHRAATWSQNRKVVELLLANGAKVNAKDRGWGTPLNWAASGLSTSRRNEVVQLLLAYGADVKASNCNGMTPFGWVADSQNQYDRALARLLRQHGA